jgi:hypothetical protein
VRARWLRAHLVVVGAGRYRGAVRRECRGRDVVRVALRAPPTSLMGHPAAALSMCRMLGVQTGEVQLGSASEEPLQRQAPRLLTREQRLLRSSQPMRWRRLL